MTINELKPGMQVKLRGFHNRYEVKAVSSGELFIREINSGDVVTSPWLWLKDPGNSLEGYNDDLTDCAGDMAFDIMEVYDRPAYPWFSDNELKLLWKRAKRMTLAEVEKALGYAVEIVD